MKMKRENWAGTASLLVVLLLLISSTVPAIASSQQSEKGKLKLPEELTKAELEDLYRKYNITENDIKFAKDELPHPLKGTILDGGKKVIATEDGKLSEHLKEKIQRNSVSWDFVITTGEMLSIMKDAEKKVH